MCARASATVMSGRTVTYSGVIDGPSHRYGPESPQALTAVRNADRILGVWRDSLAALPFAVDLIVVSDHGQLTVPRANNIDMDKFLPLAVVLADGVRAGSHWPSDHLAGFAIGVALVTTVHWLVATPDRHHHCRHRRDPGVPA